MNNREKLLQLSTNELVDIVLELRAEITLLKRENERLKQELAASKKSRSSQR